MKQRHKFESIVAETLLIPLYYRAKESRRKNPILNDKVAEGLVDSLEYDYSRFDGAKLSEVGCVVRGWFFDRAVRRFIGKHADAVVVNVGCGLTPVSSVSATGRPYSTTWTCRKSSRCAAS